MVGLIAAGERPGSARPGRRAANRPSRAGRGPIGEELEPRALLATAISAGVLSPSATVVSNAQGVIMGGASAEFTKYESELEHIEQGSRVTPAAFENLRSDAASLVQAIQYAPLTGAAESQDLVALQDILDQSFIDGGNTGSQWNAVSQQMGEALYGVTFTTDLPDQTLTDMETVAKEARVTPSERSHLVADEKAIDAALGPNVDSSLGAPVPRDPVMVYYDGQVMHFVHKR